VRAAARQALAKIEPTQAGKFTAPQEIARQPDARPEQPPANNSDLCGSGHTCSRHYWPVTGHGFLDYDDHLYVTHNTQVQGGLSIAAVVWAFKTPVVGNWHPLTMLSHMLDCQLAGRILVGIISQTCCCTRLTPCCCFLVLNRMTGAAWRSAFVAALFAVHPCTSNRWPGWRAQDVLSGCFFMLTLWAYAAYAESKSKVQVQSLGRRVEGWRGHGNTQHGTRNTLRSSTLSPSSSSPSA